MTESFTGLGDKNAAFQVYITNRPPLAEYEALQSVKPMHSGDIARIAAETGNHWRKIFNVYAKLLFAQDARGFDRWQTLRDDFLLQAGSDTALMFSQPVNERQPETIRLVLGKGYAEALGMSDSLRWLDERFAVHTTGVIVCPYFDYRQLSDARIVQLVSMLND